MKRLLSIVLTVMMLVSMASASALTLNDSTSWVTNPLELGLSLDVKGRQSGTENAYASTTSLLISSGQKVGVDYKATLNMEKVRALFNGEFIQNVLPGDGDLAAEFDAGTVTTIINVEITYPEGSVKDGVDLTNAATGVLKVDDSTETIFRESGARVLNGNKLTISFENEATTVAALRADVDGKLGDITFELEDAFEYDTVSTPEISVKFSGSTVIDFESKDQTINYKEITASHTSTITQPESSAIGSISSTYTIKFNVDGGTAVDNVRVDRDNTIKEPVTTKDGFNFLGWYEDAALTKLFDFNTPIKYSRTLYAKWEAIDQGDDETNDWVTDVKENDWFYDAVKYAYDNGIMNGVSDTEFAPNANLTRAMFVTVLYRIENEPEVTASTFTDIDVDSWYDDAVAWATKNGITNGVSDTEFAPNNSILREQIATMLYRYAQYKGYDVSAAADLDSYNDAAIVSEYAVPSFRWAVGEGILNGKSDVTLAPKDNATRAEAAALLMRMIEKYNK